MSDTPIDSTWWLASDGKWYPPTSHPNYQPPTLPDPPALPDPPSGPTVIGTPGAGPAEVAERWASGAAGEQATALELTKLPTSYHVIHGLKKGSTRGDIDHLVIGPTGVWVIDSKNDTGVLTAGKGTLWNGRYPINTKVKSAEDQARYARDVLDVPTNAVLCFVQATLPRPAQMVGRVRVIQLDALTQHIMAGQITMMPDQIRLAVERVGDWIRRPPEPASQPREAPRRSSRSRTAPTNEARRRGRLSLVGAIAILILLLSLSAVGLMFAFGAYKGLTDGKPGMFGPSPAPTTTLVGADPSAVDDCLTSTTPC